MDPTVYYIIASIVLIYHSSIAFFASRELVGYPLWGKLKKADDVT